MSIRKYKKSVIVGCAAVAAALIVLPAAARTWRGMWSNDNETGALVATVDPDGPAARAGLQRGDIILGVDETAIENHRNFMEAIRDKGVDDTLTLALRRGDDAVSLDLTVGENDSGPYLGLLLVPGGAGAFRADTFGELQDRGHRGRGRGGIERRGWHHGARQRNIAAPAGGSA